MVLDTLETHNFLLNLSCKIVQLYLKFGKIYISNNYNICMVLVARRKFYWASSTAVLKSWTHLDLELTYKKPYCHINQFWLLTDQAFNPLPPKPNAYPFFTQKSTKKSCIHTKEWHTKLLGPFTLEAEWTNTHWVVGQGCDSAGPLCRTSSIQLQQTINS